MRLFYRVEPDLLANYFATHKVLNDFPWNRQGLTRSQFADLLTEAYQEVSPKKREEIDDELSQVSDMCSIPAQESLQSACKQFGLLWDDEMMPEERTMRVLLENKNVFQQACDWCHLENYASFSDYLGPKPKDAKEWPKIEKSLTAGWELLLKNQNSGYGRVYVEHYQTDDRKAYLTYYEAPPQHVTRFKDKVDKGGKPIEDRPERDTCKALMIYYPRLGKLKVKADTESITNGARDNYARLALDDDNFFSSSENERIYDLQQFKRKLEPEDFPTDQKDEIVSVRVVSIRFKPDALTRDIVEINSVKGLKERIKLLKLDLTNAVIKRVRIQVIFMGKGAGSKKSFNLSTPNKNTLRESKKDSLIEKYLVKWGIANR